VNVDVSQGELGLALTVGSDVFEKAEPVSLVQGALGYLKGFKILGVRHVERVVPIGTPLTVVGEVCLLSVSGPKYVLYLSLLCCLPC
jgi:E3 ubiquitin-protein ligase MUL1